ncbi:MAG: ATP-binding protein involved in chromosome partitioning [Verrucomicrobiales bacterium]|jgi:ATP-binding protein involved in chromosome partitioning
MAAIPSSEDLFGVLRGVIDPELGSNIVELGMAKSATVDEEGLARITIALTTSGCPLRAQIQKDVKARVLSLPGVEKIKINWTELDQEEKAAVMKVARFNVSQNAPDTSVPSTTRCVLIASGKGGVGKSSITANLASALAIQGFRVGVLDADIWGYSIPRLLGVEGRLEGSSDSGKIAPHVISMGAGELEVVSMGFLVDSEDTALMWRGLMLNRAVQHFLQDVDWGELDYLLIDMPPGTGDVQMGLAKMLPHAEMLVVTTPSKLAQTVAVRVAAMGRNNYLRVAGVIENMSAFVDDSGTRHEVFGVGGGKDLAEQIDSPLIGEVPLDRSVVDGGDTGMPAVLGGGAAADELRRIAHLIATELIPPVDMSGCSSRIIDQALANLEAIDAAEASAEASGAPS